MAKFSRNEREPPIGSLASNQDALALGELTETGPLHHQVTSCDRGPRVHSGPLFAAAQAITVSDHSSVITRQ